MAHSLANTGAEDGVPSSEGVQEMDAVDRADRKRKYSTSRVPVHKIGYWPGNRGGTGINPNHIHDMGVMGVIVLDSLPPPVWVIH